MVVSPGFEIANPEGLASPALLIWPARVERNIQRMIDRVGGRCERLRPHVKTHKMARVVALQVAAGIEQFKTATIAETEMVLEAGGRDVLFAYPLVGPNIERLIRLAQRYPEARLAGLVDDLDAARTVEQACRKAPCRLGVFLDMDCGMGRTGIAAGESARALAGFLHQSPQLEWRGLHVYDGHIHDPGLGQREAAFAAAMGGVSDFIASLEAASLPLPVVVGGGSPTFALHAAERGWECSPGTTLFWDAGYGQAFPDLDFDVAAAVLTRIISKPGDHKLCLDLGHKAVSAEKPLERRVFLPDLPGAKAVLQSEEHLVIETPQASEWKVGDCLVGVPYHICPTVALYREAVVIEDGRATGECWEVTARDRRITV